MDPQKWLHYLLPLPQEIAFEGQVELRPEEVGIQLAAGAGEIERQAAEELRQLFVERCGCTPEGEGFVIFLGVADAQGKGDGWAVDGQRLAGLPNKQQAYTIQPGERRLIVAALDGRGVYYGGRTLYQLLKPVLSRTAAVVPLVRVVDWPDMDERGLWNFPDEEEWIPWMASLKLNYGKMVDTRLAPVERGKPNQATIDAGLLKASRRQAFNYVPYILHLNFLHDYGLYRAYPELAGKGDSALTGRYFAHKAGNQHRAPCASQPVLVDILAEWMESIAAQGADEISCWLSERPGQCACLDCTAVGQFVLEARAFVTAWQRTRRRYPKLQIRVFLSTTTYERDYRVLDELPAEVKIERACASGVERVLKRPRDLLANPLYAEYAARGRWIASYDVPIGANGKVDTPEFKLPERSAPRVRDFVGQMRRRGYRGAYGMLAWSAFARRISGFNIAALAEWSWNYDGRTTRQFAHAWATQEGYADPEKVAEWAECIGPVEFDVFDSGFPECYAWGQAVELVQRRQRPYLGEGMFRYYESEAAFDDKAAACRRALDIAAQLEDGDFAAETRVVQSYVELARCIWQVAEKVAVSDLERLDEQAELGRSIDQLRQAGRHNAVAINDWRAALGPEPWHQRVHDAVQATEDTVEGICRFAEERYLY